MLAHYGVVALPCRVGDPDRKRSKPHRSHAEAAPAGPALTSAAQAYLDLGDPLGRYPHPRDDLRQVAAGEEQPALGCLPLEPFRYYQYGVRTVHLDGCVEVEAAFYGVPPG